MKRSVFLLVLVIILIFSACNSSHIVNDDTNINDIVVFNEIDSYVSAGRRLVEPVVVTEPDFISIYSVGLKELSEKWKYEFTYRLEYELDMETNMPDLNSLSNGVVTVEENGDVIFVMYVSMASPVSSYVIEQGDIEVSQINGCKLQLFDLSRDNSTLLYGEFKLGDYYITCSMYGKTNADMISFVETIIESGHSFPDSRGAYLGQPAVYALMNQGRFNSTEHFLTAATPQAHDCINLISKWEYHLDCEH